MLDFIWLYIDSSLQTNDWTLSMNWLLLDQVMNRPRLENFSWPRLDVPVVRIDSNESATSLLFSYSYVKLNSHKNLLSSSTSSSSSSGLNEREASFMVCLSFLFAFSDLAHLWTAIREQDQIRKQNVPNKRVALVSNRRKKNYNHFYNFASSLVAICFSRSWIKFSCFSFISSSVRRPKN